MKRNSSGTELKSGRIGQETACIVACHDLALGLLLARSLELAHRTVTLIGSVSGLAATPPFPADVAVIDGGFWRELRRFGTRTCAARLAGVPVVLVGQPSEVDGLADAGGNSDVIAAFLPRSAGVSEIVQLMMTAAKEHAHERPWTGDGGAARVPTAQAHPAS